MESTREHTTYLEIEDTILQTTIDTARVTAPFLTILKAYHRLNIY